MTLAQAMSEAEAAAAEWKRLQAEQLQAAERVRDALAAVSAAMAIERAKTNTPAPSGASSAGGTGEANG